MKSLGAGCQFPSQFGGTQSGKVPTLRSPPVVPQHRYPTLATVALSVQHPWVLAWRGNEPPGCPPALVGTSGYSWQQLPLPLQLSP